MNKVKLSKEEKKTHLASVEMGPISAPIETQYDYVFPFNSINRDFCSSSFVKNPTKAENRFSKNEADVIIDTLRRSEYYANINIYRNFWMMNVVVSFVYPLIAIYFYYDRWTENKMGFVMVPVIVCLCGSIISVTLLMKTDEIQKTYRERDFRKRLCKLYIEHFKSRQISFTLGESGFWLRINLDYKKETTLNKKKGVIDGKKKDLIPYSFEKDLLGKSDRRNIMESP